MTTELEIELSEGKEEIELELMTADPIELEAQAFVKGGGEGSLSEEVKQALLQMAEHVAYIDEHGQDYYQDLYDALYPPRALAYISVVYDPGTAVIYESTSLDSLKQYVTVTAHYDDKTTEIIASEDYTLSGTLAVGTSVVTAEYRSKTKSFSVEVAETPTLSSITAVFTQGSAVIYDTDTLDTLKQYLVVTANYSDGTSEEVTTYTLSGTLTVGTSTITVSYGGKTATFDVVVSIGLDSVAFGSLTYRDIFITNNLASWFANFENNFVISGNWTYKDSSQDKGYRVAAISEANPSVSTAEYVSPNHSLDVSTSGQQKLITAYAKLTAADFGVDYIVAYAIKLSNYVSGKAEVQIFGNTSTIIRNFVAANTNGWVPTVAIGAPVKASGNAQLNFTFGAMKNTALGTPNFTAYIDDIVIVKKPSGMTLEQATMLFSNYLEMVARGGN